MQKQSLASAVLRNAVRHRKKWLIEQGVAIVIGLIGMLLPILFPQQQIRTFLAVLCIYVLLAVFLAMRRAWSELKVAFARQQMETERLEEDAKSHAGDIEYERRRLQQFNRANLATTQYFHERAIRQLLRDLHLRDAQIAHLTSERAQQMEFIRQIQNRAEPQTGDREH